MTLNVKEMSSRLSSIIENVDFTDIAEKTQAAINNFDATKKSILSGEVGQVKGGIESLTQETTSAEDNASAQLVPNIGRVTSDVPNIADKLVGSVTNGSSIESILGSSTGAANGFLQDIITATSPEAIASSLRTSVSATTTEISSTLRKNVQSGLEDVVSSAVGKVPWETLSEATSRYSTRLDRVLGANSGQYLIDFGEKLERNFENTASAIFGVTITRSDAQDAFGLFVDGSKDEAFANLRKYVSLPDNYDFIVNNVPVSLWPAEVIEAQAELGNKEGQFKQLDVQLKSYVGTTVPTNAAAGTNTLPVNVVGAPAPPSGSSRTTAFSGVTRSGDRWNFDVISSAEEIEALFRNVKRSPGREIAGAIIHWSATFLDQDVDAAWCHDLHRSIGYAGIGYHLFIRRDGTIQTGRPMNREGAHDENNNRTFLGFCFAGGVNESSKTATKPYWKYASAKSLTTAQFAAYDKIMDKFHLVFPYAQVNGHYASSNDGKQDPGFDVPGYSQAHFGHVNVIPDNDPLWSSPTPITLSTIAQYS